jgi:outer membrane protein assembly factor BamB
VVIVATEAGVHAVDRVTGESRWRLDGDVAPHGMHLDERLYVRWKETLSAVDLGKGQPLWSRPSRGNPWIQAVIGGVLYVTDGKGSRTLSAIDSSNGELLWTVDTGRNHVCAGPVEHDGRLVFGTGMDWRFGSAPVPGKLYSVDPKTGK